MMLSLQVQSNNYILWLSVLSLLVSILLLSRIIYNVFSHPLAHQFQIYGPRLRPEPNTVLFRDPEAHKDIYSMKSNVRRSQFYTALKRNKHEVTVLTSVDVADHARRRKMINLCFTKKSLAASCDFIKVDALVFDIMKDLCFRRSFDVKEPGDNPLKAAPHCIAEYMLFYYAQYNKFVYDSITRRIAQQKEQAEKPLAERRQDIFYFLCEARSRDDLSGILCTVRNCLACTYLKACIDEGMRLTLSGPCELPREALLGGHLVKGEYYPEGTIVGTVTWADSHNKDVYGDAEVFRPERWIVDDANSKEEVARLRFNFHPLFSGLGSCVGKNVAMAEMMIMVARTLYRFQVRAPGSMLGGGLPDLGWGRIDGDQFQLVDAYISLRQGPEVQFKKRAV
ncbi:benzoate 4-monooxygenase cytochrome P450 [Xylaria sp. FL1042]|nr:benzoate 4-monooxygenase cytochrome P450 [Xylaria sp. FL1042]